LTRFCISKRTTVQFTPQPVIDSEKSIDIENKTTFKTRIKALFLSLNRGVCGNTVTGLTSYIKIFTHIHTHHFKREEKTATQRSQEIILTITLIVFRVANDYINELPVPLSAV
jgi:hypothetical protein